tara:strand:- start:892 stop:1977 length:1086 start_codon:yes stop_codon:yes gene_type:complete
MPLNGNLALGFILYVNDIGHMAMKTPIWIHGRQRFAERSADRRPMRRGHVRHATACLCAAGALVAGLALPVANAADPEPDTKSDKPWSVTLEAGMQHDDSVSIDALDNRSGQADRARVFNLGGDYTLLQKSALPIKLSYAFAKTSYRDLKAFNLQSHTAFVSTRKKVAGLDAGFLYGFSHTDLDGKPFLNFHTVTPTLGHGLTTNWYVLAGYNYQNKTFHTAKSRNAQVNGLSLDNFFFFNETRSYIKAGYRFEMENAARNEFDFAGHYLNIGLKSALGASPGDATIRFSYQYYLRDYTNETPSISREREDQRHTAKAEIAVPVHEHAQMKFSYKYIKAHSNLSTSDFDENVINVSLALKF